MNTFKQVMYPIRTAMFEKEQVELYIQCFGCFQSSGDFLWEQIVSSFSIHALKEGSGVMERNGVDFKVEKGDLYVFWPGDHIKYYDYPESPWRYEWIQLSGSKVESILKRSGFNWDEPHVEVSSLLRFWSTLEKLKSKIAQDNYSSVFPIAIAWEFLDILEPHLKGVHLKTEYDFLAEKCRQLIDNQLSKNPSISDLARQCDVNRSTLFRAFRKEFGISPKEYISEQRMEKACKLLKQTQLSIKEISHICGFREQYYFSNTFRKQFGIAPSLYRSE